MSVDASTHVWSDRTWMWPWQPLDGVEPPSRPAGPDLLVAELDAARVERAVCVQPRAYGYDHGFLIHTVRQHHQRLRGVGLLNPHRPTAVGELGRLVDLGLSGVRVILLEDLRAAGIAARKLDGVFAAAAEREVPVSLLCRPDQLGIVARRARRSPATSFVLDHLGLVGADHLGHLDRLLDLARYPNVAVKVSGLTSLSEQPPPHLDLRPVVGEIRAAFPPDRLLWGTDSPHHRATSDTREQLDATRELLGPLDAQEHAAIFGGTADRLHR